MIIAIFKKKKKIPSIDFSSHISFALKLRMILVEMEL